MANVIKLFRNPFFSAFVSFFVLAVVAVLYREGWIVLFSVFFSFVLSDLILNCFIRGGKRWTKVLFENDFTCKGYAFLVFLIGIVVGTLTSIFVADFLMNYLQTQMSWLYASLLTDLIAVSAVLGDLLWRFY